MKTIVIGVSGGIACYKAVEVVNQLKKDGYNVEVIMTRSAQEFVTPLTFKTMSHNPVVTEMFDPVREWDTKHIDLAKAADCSSSSRQPPTSSGRSLRELLTTCSPPP